MTVRRLRVPVSNVDLDELVLPVETSRYVTRVHRLREGDRVTVFDPERALEADAEIVSVRRDGTVLKLSARRGATIKPIRRITLIQSVGKGDKFDEIVRDGTALGVTRLVPIVSERSIARPMDETRSLRWRRIAVEAARQCGRGDAPVIELPMTLGDALLRFGKSDGTIGVCLDPRADKLFGHMFASLTPELELVMVVGPEGGLSPGEIEACTVAGFTGVSLGPFILRTETVCAAVLGALLIAAPTDLGPPSTVPLTFRPQSLRTSFTR